MTRRKKRHAVNKARRARKRAPAVAGSHAGVEEAIKARDAHHHKEVHVLLTELLKVADSLRDLERHCAQLEQEGVAKVPRRSVGIVFRMLLRALKTQHVEPMDSKGKLVDLERHEVVEVQHVPDLAADIIIEESLPGYMWRDRVLRTAKVIASQADHHPKE